ncbi:MAG: hypothetical protein ABIJ08_01285, partial [Nanoarchaeota archaeon]
MNRNILLKKAFQRGHLLTVKNRYYKQWLKSFIVDETKADIGTGDITSNLLDDKKAKAIIYSRSEGIVAGLEEVSFLFKNSKITVKQLKKDGSKIKKRDGLMMIHGKIRDILKLERSALDIISRASGIATLTNNLITKTQIAPTRKTLWRYLDKKAVYLGGGLTHRLALWESILIKDNHLKKIDIETALRRAWENRNKANFIEIETKDEKETIHAAETFKKLKGKTDYPCLILLDNMQPNKIKSIIKRLKSMQLYDYVLIEASGGITP